MFIDLTGSIARSTDGCMNGATGSNLSFGVAQKLEESNKN